MWFDDVERLAAEKGGLETVQYVVNVRKDCVAYEILKEQASNRDQVRRVILKMSRA